MNQLRVAHLSILRNFNLLGNSNDWTAEIQSQRQVNSCHVIPFKIEEIDSAATADGEAKETLVHLVCSDWLDEKS